MLTIFTVPKPFQGDHINIIQRNAIKSWTLLEPRPEIILMGEEEGTEEVCKEFGLRHIPMVERNQYGTPLVNSIFSGAAKAGSYPIMCYVNADIVLLGDFISAIKMVKFPLFLLSGRRWDLDIEGIIDFDVDWERKLYENIEKKGRRHGCSGIDYFIFPRGLSHNLPAFAVGRPGWDNWLIYHIRSLRIPVIDATKVISVIHQTHDYSHCLKGERDKGPEARRNFKLAGGFSGMCTLYDADWVLTTEGLKRPKFPRRFLAGLSLFYPWRLILSIKRKISKLFKQYWAY